MLRFFKLVLIIASNLILFYSNLYANDSLVLTDLEKEKNTVKELFLKNHAKTKEPNWKYHKVGDVDNIKNISELIISYKEVSDKLVPYEALIKYDEKIIGIDGHGIPVNEPAKNNFMIFVYDTNISAWNEAPSEYYKNKQNLLESIPNIKTKKSRDSFFIIAIIFIFFISLHFVSFAYFKKIIEERKTEIDDLKNKINEIENEQKKNIES